MSKKLSEMTLEELWILFPIILKEHNSDYGLWYQAEKESLINLIGTNKISRISHIGSSAVEDLISKPTVDILLELKEESDFNEVTDNISTQGWTLMSSQEKPYKSKSFNKGYTDKGFAEKVYHLHLRYAGNWNELYFRDYLIENKEVAEQYAKLKLNLIEQFKNNRDAYTKAKSEFIKQHTEEAKKKYKNRYKTNNKTEEMKFDA